MIDPFFASIWRGTAPLILASTSHTRRDLLASAGLEAETVAPEVDERAIEAEADLTPTDLAMRLALAKAESVARRHPDRVVVGADQVLACDGAVFHKPADTQAARAHLARLQGRTHVLHSGVALVWEGRAEAFCDTARLTMRPLDAPAIATYVALAGEARVTSSVGAYRLEGLGLHLFEKIEGDHSTILGLPLLPLLARLRATGLLAF